MRFSFLCCKDDTITLTVCFGQINLVTAKICNTVRMKKITRGNFLRQKSFQYLLPVSLDLPPKFGIVKGTRFDNRILVRDGENGENKVLKSLEVVLK